MQNGRFGDPACCADPRRHEPSYRDVPPGRNRRDRREVSQAIGVFRGLERAYFKFVIVEPVDVDEVCRLVERYDIPADRVLLMPEGVTARAVLERGRWVAEACTRHGFRFSTRLHILLWGDQRGR